MQIIGFNLTKMSGEKLQEKITAKPSLSIEFTNLEKETIVLLKENEALKVSFKHELNFEDQENKKEKPQGKIYFEGNIIMAVSKDEFKEITKAWKKKKLPANLNIILFNLILKKCTPKSIFLEDEIGIPIHTPTPRLTPKNSEPSSQII
jgi:hypothetical protein